MKLMRFFFHELQMKKDRKKAGEILVNSKPPVMDDVVYVHAAVEGIKKRPKVYNEGTYREEFVNAYYPLRIGDRVWRAISWTTAASVVGVVEMVAKKQLPQEGFIKQEDISLETFLKTQTGKLYQQGGRLVCI
jgi:saccharopine dehydrogenase-like NADP-dependent oxidoreductase